MACIHHMDGMQYSMVGMLAQLLVQKYHIDMLNMIILEAVTPSYTLHPAPHILHPTVHPSPYILRRTSYILLYIPRPTPYVVHPRSGVPLPRRLLGGRVSSAVAAYRWDLPTPDPSLLLRPRPLPR